MSAAPDRRPAARPITPEEMLDAVPQGGELFNEDGPYIRCPACERWFHLFNLRVMQFVEKYARDTVPVYRCPRHRCGHYFALDPNPRR